MSKPKISIIIPVYNVEKYLRECLDSCVNQTLEDIEIICVDDCSTDNSFKILEKYQARDPRIRIFQQDENKKQGAARNKGLEVATGEYIWFVDSDDYIDPKACEILYSATREFNVDVLCFSAIRLFEQEGHSYFVYNKYFNQGVKINKIYHPKTNWQEAHFSHLHAAVWMFLTKRQTIQKFRFREGVWHEDTDFTPILFTSVDSFCYIPYTAYFYRITPGSTTQTDLSKKRFEDIIKALESLDNFVTVNKIKRRHFLYKHIVSEIYTFSEIYRLNTHLNPTNLNTLIHIQQKYHKALTLYKKIFYPQKYSVKRFLGKILKKLDTWKKNVLHKNKD